MSGDVAQFDVVIIGGGMVGATTACALGAQGLSVALVETQLPMDRPQLSDAARVSAFTRASEQIFRALDAWDAMQAQRASPFREMHVWDEAGRGAIHFDCADLGENTLGHIIENAVVQAALWERLQTQPHITTYCPATPQELHIDDERVEVKLADGRCLHAALLVGSDGNRSWVRSQCRIALKIESYDQRAVVATITSALPHRETAWQRFTPEGPVALLPLADGRSSLVWSVATSRAEELLTLNEEQFLRELQFAFGDALGELIATGSRSAYPLQRTHADRYVSPRIALVGDAAHTVHPLAGQGVNLGLLDAGTLAEVLGDARRTGRDVGSLHVLRRYERWRKGHNTVLQLTIDGLKKLFAHRHPAVIWARNLGLRYSDTATPLKNLLTQHAIGLRGDLPKVARAISKVSQ